MEKIDRLIEILCEERREKPPKLSEDQKFDFFRALVNIRPPKPASSEFLSIQDEFLKEQIALKGITKMSDLRAVFDDIYLWRGDITTLEADSIVNAANSQMLGCFCPCHACIDNCIHTYSGVQLRLECAKIMQKQGRSEPTGSAKITPAFNLPSKFVLHTVGPIIQGALKNRDRELLASCYRSCLSLADSYNLGEIAFCCISTGEFHFPNEEAAKIAVSTVVDYKRETNSKIKVIFNVFKENDYGIYKRLLERG